MKQFFFKQSAMKGRGGRGKRFFSRVYLPAETVLIGNRSAKIRGKKIQRERRG